MIKIFLYSFFVLFLFESFSVTKKVSNKEVSRDYLVKRLEKLFAETPSSHPSKKPITLRLAHILSLRAESNLLKQDCKSCRTVGIKDAQRSLSLYRAIGSHINRKHPLLYTQSLFQISYLYRLMNHKQKAIEYLAKVTQLDIDKRFITRAYFNIGEIYFESYNYTRSLAAFNKVLKSGKTEWEFRAFYRQIWSLYNISSYNKAIQSLEKLLQSSLYKEVSLPEELEIKRKLQTELIDLYSRSKVTQDQIQFLYNFQKDNQAENTEKERKERIFYLAESLNRIGRVILSNKVFYAYLEKDPPALRQIQSYTSIIDNNFIIGDKGWLLRTGQVVEKVFDLQSEVSSCPQDICKKVKKQQKRYIEELQRQVLANYKLKPYLLSMYQSYNKHYSSEFDMVVKSAFIAKDLKQYILAQELFQKSGNILKVKMANLSSAKSSSKDLKNIKNDLEQVSVLQMEMGELSEDEQKKDQAYDFYIANGVNSRLIFQAQYQKAYKVYQGKNYKESSQLFKNLALKMSSNSSSEKIADFALKSAHLALSSLNFLDDKDHLMAEWTALFMKIFPRNKRDFVSIYHTALFNIVKSLVSDKDFSSYPVSPSKDVDVVKAWDILQEFDLKEMNQSQKIDYYMNKLLFAKELFKFDQMDRSMAYLMNVKSLGKEDSKTVLSWQLWLAESRFEFLKSLQLVKKIDSQNNTEDHYLRLARLSELSNKNNLSYYKKYLEKFPKSEKSFDIVSHIIEKSPKKDKKDLLKKYALYFKDKPDDLTFLVLKIDDGRLNESFLRFFINLSFMEKTLIHQYLEKKSFIESFEKSFKVVNQFVLPSTSSTRKLSRFIKKYNALIEGLEKEVEKSVKMKDWLSQVVSFSKFHEEVVRFYTSILNLPLPKGLTPEEQLQYKKLIEDQMSPYKEKAVKLQGEINKLLAHSFIQNYADSIEKGGSSQGILKWELRQLSSAIKPGDNRRKEILRLASFSKDTIKKTTPVVTKAMLEQVYLDLRSKPFDKKVLTKLLKLETSRGSEALSYYLMNRIEKIKQAKGGRVSL